MTRKSSKNPKFVPKETVHSLTKIRQWREYRDLSLEETAELVGEYLRKHGLADGYTHASLGRLERGEFAYKQPIMEALAHVLETDVGSLISRDPTDHLPLVDAIEGAPDQVKAEIMEHAQIVLKKAGLQ